MIRCRKCGGANPDENVICQYCDQDLPPELIREFLFRNSPIFTIGALFTALTFYLLALVKQSQLSLINGTVSIVALSQKNTQDILPQGNFSYSILLQPSSMFQNSFAIPFVPLNEALILAFLSCFLILCGIIFVLLKDLYRSSRGNPSIYHVFMFLLLTLFIVLNIFYILSNFLNESIYFVFFGLWVTFVYVNLIIWKIAIKNIKQIGYLVGTAFLGVVQSVLLYVLITYLANNYLPSLNNSSLGFTLTICLIITALLAATELVMSLYLVAMIIITLIIVKIILFILEYAKLHPDGKIAKCVRVHSNVIERCKKRLRLRKNWRM